MTICMKKRKWTNGVTEELVRLYGTAKNRELAKRFGVTEDALRRKAHVLGLKTVHRKRWTERMQRELEMLYAVTTADVIAERLGVTKTAVYNRAYRTGLRRGLYARKRPAKDGTWMRLNFPHMSNAVCALLLGVSERTVVRMARRLGLEKTE